MLLNTNAEISRCEAEFRKIIDPKFIKPGWWTPVEVVKESSQFLSSCKNVLDIGSGIGKFCLLSAKLNPSTVFTGVELLENHYNESVRLKEVMEIPNVEFILSDFRKLDLDKYDGFYIFNPFVVFMGSREEEIKCELAFREVLGNVKSGTKLIMYNPFVNEPKGFKHVSHKGFSSSYETYIKK